MTREEALRLFYERNGIQPFDVHLDPRLQKLPDRLDAWLRELPPADHPAFLTLLSGYTYLTTRTASEQYAALLNRFEAELNGRGIPLSAALFVTFEASNGKKGGSSHVQTDFHRLSVERVHKAQIVASVSRLPSVESAQAILFLDDIQGSGKTTFDGISGFCKRFPAVLDSKLPLYFAALVPTERGERFVTQACLDKGISITPFQWGCAYSRRAFEDGFLFPRGEQAPEYARVKQYEDMIDAYLANPPKKHPKRARVSCSMGFEDSQLLVSFYYNTPNNTLCSFWKETDRHIPLFYRQGRHLSRPSPREMERKARALTSAAYAMGETLWEDFHDTE